MSWRPPHEVRAKAAQGVPVILKGLLSPREIEVVRRLAGSASCARFWQHGRQETGYEKLNLRRKAQYESLEDRNALELISLRCREAMDAREETWDFYILRYPDLSYIPPHRDEAGLFGLRHVRINALVRQSASGGQLCLGRRAVQLDVGDALFFYPDEVEHSVDAVRGERLVLTCGAWVPRD